ncbi:MAG TPA: hypothetical protein PLJ21_01060 [Pseudobdellovibrionaceae bacterium]|nr:hypothetical protein [Pseudobdellovibrionaceae bacterium]
MNDCCKKYLDIIQPIDESMDEIRTCVCEAMFRVQYLSNEKKIITQLKEGNIEISKMIESKIFFV